MWEEMSWESDNSAPEGGERGGELLAARRGQLLLEHGRAAAAVHAEEGERARSRAGRRHPVRALRRGLAALRVQSPQLLRELPIAGAPRRLPANPANPEQHQPAAEHARTGWRWSPHRRCPRRRETERGAWLQQPLPPAGSWLGHTGR